MARGLSVFVNIGAKVASSVGASAAAVERRLGAMGRRINLANAEARAASRGLSSAGDVRGKIFDSVAIGLGFAAAVKPALDFEDALVRVGNTAQVYGAPLANAGKSVINTGKQFGYGGEDALSGANDFVAAGMKLDTALSALTPTLMLAKTANVEVTEASQSGIALMQNLDVAVTDLGSAFDIMAKAGKEGRFEINDMARAFPGLSSRAKSLGMVGLDGVKRMSAMLQITRQNARDADEAENNLLNFLDKLTGHETQQHFAKMGVNLEKLYKKSKKNGTDFVDDTLDELARLTKDGSDQFALTELFPDRQARQAASALLTNRKEYERIKDAVKSASGVLSGDWERVSKTAKTSTQRLGAALKSIAITFGAALGPSIASASESLAKLSGKFSAFAEKNPEVVAGLAKLGAALVGLVIGAKLGSVVVTAFSRLAIAGRWLLTVMGPLGMAIVRGFVLPVAAALMTLGLPAIGVLAGIALALVALGVAIAWVVAKWDGIKAFFAGIGEGFSKALTPESRAALSTLGNVIVAAFSPIVAIGGAVVDVLGKFAHWVGSLFAPADVERWRAGGVGFGEVLGGMVNGLVSFVSKISEAIGKIREFFGAAATGFSGAAVNIGQPAFGAVAPKAPGRALGGSVSGGKAYQWHERGREMFVPGRSGTVIPAHVVAAMAKGGGQGGGITVGAINIHGATDPAATAAAVRAELGKIARSQRALLSD